MSQYITHFLVAIAVWWLATGAVVIAARRGAGEGDFGTSLVNAIAAASIPLLIASGWIETVAGAYMGFFGALGIWAWHETAFLTGRMAGPSRSPCPPGAKGWERFWAAYGTIRHHEYALAGTLAAIAALQLFQPNRTGLYVFALLWAMRLSTKLNIFFGAPNSVSALLPQRLSYLTSYFRTDRVSVLFWPSIAFCTALFAFLCVLAAAAADASGHELAAYTLLAAFALLATVEHLFLVLPISDSALWRWAIGNTGKPEYDTRPME